MSKIVVYSSYIFLALLYYNSYMRAVNV